jgi:hypothetical protein
VKIATNKRLLISESRGDSNRCTPYRGKPDQHATYAFHTSPRTLGVRFCGRSPYVATFCESSTELDRVTAPAKKGSRHNPQHAGGPIRGSAPSFSPEPTNEAVKKATHLSTVGYYAYRAHIIGMRSVRSILAHGGQPNGP